MREIKIQSPDRGLAFGKVLVDGHDISAAVHRIDITLVAGDINRIMMECYGKLDIEVLTDLESELRLKDITTIGNEGYQHETDGFILKTKEEMI